MEERKALRGHFRCHGVKSVERNGERVRGTPAVGRLKGV